jgi:hypothetical protein
LQRVDARPKVDFVFLRQHLALRAVDSGQVEPCGRREGGIADQG